MGAYVRKSCYGSMGKKLLCMHPPLNEFDQLGGFFFSCRFCSLAHLDGGLEKRREGDASRD